MCGSNIASLGNIPADGKLKKTLVTAHSRHMPLSDLRTGRACWLPVFSATHCLPQRGQFLMFIVLLVGTILFCYCFDRRFDKFRRCLRTDCIAVAPQESHPAGNPISQALKAGFNAPRFSVETIDEFVITPRATTFKLTVAFVPSGRRPVNVAPFAICEPSALAAVGVGHPPKIIPCT